MAELRPIRTEAEHDRAMAEAGRLWGAPDGSDEGDRLEVLLTLIDAYESVHYPMDPPDQLTPFCFGWSNKD
jgi:HTH-type transcriptional regulator/antitoxin HigA